MATKRIFKVMTSFLFSHLELFFWAGALISLAFSSPNGQHFTICPMNNLGFDFCPGCGLGRSISCAFHGKISASLEWHPLGIFAIGVILHRITTLVISSIKFNHQKLQKL